VATSTDRTADPVELSDEELSAVALAADPAPTLEDDAVSLWDLIGYDADRRLPAWYMPAPMGGHRVVGWRRRLILLIIVAFVVIDAYGLCNTYGLVKFG
jgi:hypothetical protein